jgi:hypothetical protein
LRNGRSVIPAKGANITGGFKISGLVKFVVPKYFDVI